MTEPRHLVPGATYVITRRCALSQYLLRPCRETNAIFLYCMAVAAMRTGVHVHVAVQMADHWRGVVTDPEGRLPEFTHFMHVMIARAMNARLRNPENFWASGHTSVAALPTADDILDAMAEVIASPTQAGFVPSPSDWPGVLTTGLRELRRAVRPEGYFRAGEMPDEVVLGCTLPPLLRKRDDRYIGRAVRRRVDAIVNEARRRVLEGGGEFLGRAGVLARSCWYRSTEVRSEREAEVVARDPGLRQQLLARLDEFRRVYRDALDQWRDGARRVIFPFGTYLMRVFHHAVCAPG